MRAAILAGAFSIFVACAPAESPVVKTISLRMQGTPREAVVIVDEEDVGQLDFVQAHGVALPPGMHHVTVKAPGYFPLDREVEAKPGSPPIRLEVALTSVPD
jgi:hypothetical protein